MRVVIVGAGIGGLTAAALLGRAGHDVVVVERARALGEVGAGIQISPNASRVFAELEAAEELRAIGTAPRRVVLRRWEDDRELMTLDLAERLERRHGHPYVNVYRPDLIALLAQLAGSTPGVTMRLGEPVVDVSAEEPAIELASGARIGGDVVIGADGIHSKVQSMLFDAPPARFSCWVAYRALVPTERLGDMPVEVTNRLGPDAHLVSYFVGEHRQFVNLVAVVHEPDWAIESWTEPGDLETLRQHFDGWSPGVHELFDRIEPPIFRWALRDRAPLDSWVAPTGRVALLGDACHPMVPFAAQGACQAIEDAAILTRCFDVDSVSVPGALATYDATRRPRASELQARSFDNATTYHLPDGAEQRERDAFFGLLSSPAPNEPDPFDPIYAHDVFTEPLVTPSGR